MNTATIRRRHLATLTTGIASFLGLGIMPAIPATVSWNMSTATGTFSNPADFDLTGGGGTIIQYNSFGTATMISTTSASSGYAGATGTNNAGIPSRIGALNIDAGGSPAFEFSFTPAAGSTLTFSDLIFGTRSTSTGPQAWSLRSSLDGYASDIATGAIGNNSAWSLKDAVDFSLAISAPITFRLFGYNGAGSAASGTINWRIDDMVLSYISGTPVAPLYWDTNGAVAGIGGAGNWDTTTANWSSAVTGDVATTTFSSASAVVFGGPNSGFVTVTGANTTVTGGLKFETAGYHIEGNSVTLNTSGVINTTHGIEGATTISSVIAGNAGLTKSGDGPLVLTGANTFDGPVNLNGGAVTVTTAANLGKDTNVINFGGGKLIASDNINLTAAQSIAGSPVIEIAAGKTVTIPGTTNAALLTLSGTGTLALNSATPTVGAITITDAATITSTGTISAATITTTNTTGTAVISGNLNLGATGRLVTVADGAAEIDLALDGAITMTGASSRLQKVGPGTLRLGGDNSGLAAGIQMGQAGTQQTAGGTVVITNKNALGSSGAFQIFFNDGTLRATTPLTGANAIPVGMSIGAGQLGPATFTGSDMQINGASAIFRAGGSAYTHQIRVENTTTFTGGLGVAGAGSEIGIALTGPGTLVLSGADNTVNLPITVDGPTLVINSPLTASAATVTVINGKLTGSSSIAGTTTLQGTAILAPGDGVGTLTVGADLNIGGIVNSNAALQFELGSIAASDRVVLTSGALAISSGVGGGLAFSSFDFITGVGFGAGIYTLFDTTLPIDAFGPLSGTVGGLNATVALSPDGTDIVLNVVPEPGSAAMLLGGLGILAARRRRR